MTRQARSLRFRRWRLYFMSVVVAVLLCMLATVIWGWAGLRPAQPQAAMDVTVIKGETTRELAEALKGAGVIRNARLFSQYLSLTHASQHIQVGVYHVQPGMSVGQLRQKLLQGPVVDSVRVVIPEGFTVKQIAERLSQRGICSGKDFIRAEQSTRLTPPILKKLHIAPSVKYRLEGYLFPDTYEFIRGESPMNIVNSMLQDFAVHVNPKLQQAAHQKGLTFTQWVTEASLIEKEAKVDSERPMIASVIENRLRIGSKLQIDATLQYVLGHHNVLTVADTKVNDPYNTYRVNGLPPGPIANPGMASLLAVLRPAKTPYFYYVVRNDGSGRDYFARTYVEQMRNIRRSQQNLKRFGH